MWQCIKKYTLIGKTNYWAKQNQICFAICVYCLWSIECTSTWNSSSHENWSQVQQQIFFILFYFILILNNSLYFCNLLLLMIGLNFLVACIGYMDIYLLLIYVDFFHVCFIKLHLICKDHSSSDKNQVTLKKADP